VSPKKGGVSREKKKKNRDLQRRVALEEKEKELLIDFTLFEYVTCCKVTI
jgi:hypothetical protein